jgi:hypothetical protein
MPMAGDRQARPNTRTREREHTRIDGRRSAEHRSPRCAVQRLAIVVIEKRQRSTGPRQLAFHGMDHEHVLAG